MKNGLKIARFANGRNRRCFWIYMQKHLFIIGAPKAGTTSFAAWLASNDRFFLPEAKEPGFFREPVDEYVMNSRGDRGSTQINFDPQKYMALFEAAGPDQWLIDASTDYLSDVGAADRIKSFAQDKRVKVLCILRDPIDRAFSEYQHTMRDGLQTNNFRKAITLEEQRRRENYQPLFFHVRRSQYFDDIKRFQRLFADDFLLLDYKALDEYAHTRDRLAEFLGEPIDLDAAPPVLNVSRVQTHFAARRVMENSFARKIARSIIGPDMRNAVWSAISRIFKRNLKLKPRDRGLLLDLLKDDILACHNDSSIPTQSWRSVSDITERSV